MLIVVGVTGVVDDAPIADVPDKKATCIYHIKDT